MAAINLFNEPPVVEFRPTVTHCVDCGNSLNVQKTRIRKVSTLHIGQIRAREVFLNCQSCSRMYRSEELQTLVPPGANFGYDVLVYAGKALLLRHRTEEEAVTELALKNVQISPREVSLLAMKFVAHLALAHRRRAPDIAKQMHTRGGYICHLDATCEGGDPILMSSIDSLSEIVLGNVKMPAESAEHIEPFLKRIKQNFGTPLALVHDMGKGILAAVAKVFPGVPDFICHFHFLRDIGKDCLGAEYDIIRKRLRKHGIIAKLRYRAKQLKSKMDQHPELISILENSFRDLTFPKELRQFVPVINTYALIQWALQGKSEGHGYGFPFDHPHLSFAKRLCQINQDIERIKDIHLRGDWKDNSPYFKLHVDLQQVMKDKKLWDTVEAIEEKITVFEKLRRAMRIALQHGSRGLNDEGHKGTVRTIKKEVTKFRNWLITQKDYQQNAAARKMVDQIDKYWEKLFADPISVQTPTGPVQIQPQRTNNILEQFFRAFKSNNRRRTGSASSARMLRTILAETPLVKNLENPAYVKILLNGKASLGVIFAETEIETFRKAFRDARMTPEKIPAKLKALIAMPDFPEKLVSMVEKTTV